MPRKRRKKSGTDVYHVVSHGNNCTAILETDVEKTRYLLLLKEKRIKYGIDIYAYCLMSNHVHILLKAKFELLPLFMKEVNLEFAVYYNIRHGNVGHVFQARYYSGCVETESYLVSCIRYIHNNPVKACLVQSILEYSFSSAKEYFAEEKEKKEGCISEEGFRILEKRFHDKKEFYEFHKMFDKQAFVDTAEDKEAYDEERVYVLLRMFLKENKISNVKMLFSVVYYKEQFLIQCNDQTGIPKLKIENILKKQEKSTCPLLSNLSDIN